MISTFEQKDGASRGHDERMCRTGVPGEAPLRACAHAAPVAGDHTTARSGTLWRNTLSLIVSLFQFTDVLVHEM